MNVGIGVDHTLYALKDGIVEFRTRRGSRSYVNVLTAPAAVATVATARKTAKKVEPKADDLRKIEGIGPKIAELFQAAGLISFADVAGADPERLKEILNEAGPHFASHDPGTWPKQAALAAAGKWDELKALQDELQGGK
ncbi:MAG: 50S ribosomal protein L27 [Flavobacteriales bacterium]|nr:50S ribosomal protein L27 [Flavobacteriales bacterium]